jgi:hypothetical protein
MTIKTICQECHTPNTPGSKFCSNCGARLPKSTSILCARCQTPNPSSNIYCDKCGTRLSQEMTPAPVEPESQDDLPTSAKMFSLPTRKPGETGELTADNVMDWLMASAQPETEPDSPDTGKLPRLSDLTPDLRDSDADLPAWLFDSDSPEPIIDTQPDITTAHFLNLIRQIDDEERRKLSGMLSEALPSEGGTLPDWLQEFVQSGEAPDKERTPEAKAPAAPPPDTAEDEDFDWLAELGPPGSGLLSPPVDNTTAPKVMTGDLADLPDWLEELGPPNTELLSRPGREPETPAPTPGQMGSEMSDWLDEFGPPNTDLLAQPREAEASSGSEQSGETLPDWLISMRPDTESLSQPLRGTQAAETAETPDSDFPDWLVQPVDTSPLAFPHPAEPDTTASERADWWREADKPDETETDAAPASPDETAVAWFSTLAEEEEEEELADTPTAVSPPPEVRQAQKSLTDWLGELEDEEPSPPVEPEVEAPDDWLAAEPAESAIVDEEEDDDEAFLAVGMTGALPDWLDELEPDKEESAELSPATMSVDFLDELLGISESAAPPVATPEVEEAVKDELEPDLPEEALDAEPDWLSELVTYETDEAEPAEETAVTPSPVDEDQPYLLEADGEMELVEEAAAALFEEAGSPAEADDEAWTDIEDFLSGKVDTTEFPDWLEQFESPAIEMLSKTGDEEEEDPAIATGELPDWITNLRPDETVSDGLRPSIVPIPEEMPDLPADFAPAKLPDWLQDPDIVGAEFSLPFDEAALPDWVDSDSDLSESSDELAAILAALPPTQPLEDRLIKAEMPDWLLDLKPPELSGMPPPSLDLRAETTGPLAGMLGAVQVEPVVAMPRAVTPLLPYTATNEQTQQARLLRQLVQEMEASAPAAPARAEGYGQTWLRVALALVLLAIALFAWFAPDWLVSGSPAPLSPATVAVHEAVQAAADRPVLVAFEYTPAFAAELDHAARLLLAELEENGSPILTVSQYAAGTAVASTLSAPYPHQPIGLLAGDAIGLRQLGSCLEDNAVACGTLQGRALSADLQTALQDVALVVVLTSERASLVNWVEQVGATTQTPIVAGVTQALAPVAAPYAATGQLTGVLAGLPAVVAYADAFETPADMAQARSQYGAQGWAQLVAAVILLLGALVVGLTRPKMPAREV